MKQPQMKAPGLALACLLLGGPVLSQVRVIDGDTLALAGTRWRLAGIDAPELVQSCLDRQGSPWPCGYLAKGRLVELIGAKPVTCRYEGTDIYNRHLGECFAGNLNLNASMVSGGYAIANRRYLREQEAAKRAKLGIWQGAFQSPKDFRKEHLDNSPRK